MSSRTRPSGTGTIGIIKIRVEGTHADFADFLEELSTGRWTLIESSRAYKNRDNDRYRWYLTFKRD